MKTKLKMQKDIFLFHPDLIQRSGLIDDLIFYDSNEALHLSEEERDHIYSLLDKIAEEYERSKLHKKLLLDFQCFEVSRYYDRQFFSKKCKSRHFRSI